MPAFQVRYYFGKDEFIEERIEAEDVEEARHLAFTRYKPSRNDAEFEVREGDIIRVGLRDAVRYYTIVPAQSRVQRVGLRLKVRPEKLAEYRRLHDPIWPELAAELKAAGMRNYSLWLQDDGTEFGYLECDDWDAACAYLAQSEVHTRWQDMMQEYLDTPTDAGQGGQPVRLLEQVFLLP